MFSSLREYKPNAPNNNYTNPLSLDHQKIVFLLFTKNTIMDTLPEEPSLPGTALQFSQNTDSLTNSIKLVKRILEGSRAIEESTRGKAKMFWGMTTEKASLQPQMYTLLKLPR